MEVPSQPDFLPELSAGQRQFGSAYYPVFLKVKHSVLAVSGAVLLFQHGNLSAAELTASLTQAGAILQDAADEWRRNEPGRADREVNHLLGVLQETILSMMQSSPQTAVSGEHLDKISTAYQSLRQVALRYWRLELVPESQTLHHHN